ncbi:MAG: hypothetical protein EP344_05475 [Bacteroidetes bacterium]|nr:MAG: hypothetical protein EP344_05475 [Bacteroidota bacterium]
MKNSTWGLGILLVSVASVLLFCVKPPDYPIEPVITFESLSKDIMFQSTFGQDSVVITFSFTDGDGDLGFKDDQENIFIIDGRDSFQKPSYRIPYIEQQGAGNGISGEISIVVPTTCCIYPPPLPPCDTINAPQQLDTVFYLIQIQDQAGHLSNQIQTAPITLICRRQ